MSGTLQVGGITLGTHNSGTGKVDLTNAGTANIANATITAGTLGSSVVFPFDGTTDAGRIIQVKTSTSQETNTLTTTFTARWNYSITLKSSTSKVLVFHTENSYNSSNNGYGVKIYRDDSVINDSVTTVPTGTNSALVYDTGTGNAQGDPHAIYSDSGQYVISPLNFLDDVSSDFNAGDTVYYGHFYRKYTGGGTVSVPVSSANNGFFRTIIMEVQK